MNVWPSYPFSSDVNPADACSVVTAMETEILLVLLRAGLLLYVGVEVPNRLDFLDPVLPKLKRLEGFTFRL